MEFLSFGQVRSCLGVMADLGAQENTYAYKNTAGVDKNFLTIQGIAKYFLKSGRCESDRVPSGGSFTAVEAAGASETRHEMELGFLELAREMPVGTLAIRVAEIGLDGRTGEWLSIGPGSPYL